MQRFICLVIGYVFGLFQTSYIIGRTHNIDIRKVGSGNAGSTNTLRVLGVKAGFTSLILDILKCVAAVWVVSFLFRNSGKNILPLLKVYAGAGCVLGHNFPFYLNFKGGKGIAASLGLIIALDLKITLVAAIVFLSLFFLTHYVSFSSLCAYLAAWISMIVFGALGFYGMNLLHTTEMDVVFGLLTVLAFFRHKGNIRRLISGTERKTYLGKKKKS